MQRTKLLRTQGALVIERFAPKRSLLVDLLKELGFRIVMEAPSPDAAFDCLDAAVFDVVFVEVSGRRDQHFHFIRRLRVDRARNTRIPIIVVSANSHRDVIERTRDAGANGFLAKPFSRGALQLQLVRIANDRRAFIDVATFAGPDRRRWNDPHYRGPERRRAPSDFHMI